MLPAFNLSVIFGVLQALANIVPILLSLGANAFGFFSSLFAPFLP